MLTPMDDAFMVNLLIKFLKRATLQKSNQAVDMKVLKKRINITSETHHVGSSLLTQIIFLFSP